MLGNDQCEICEVSDDDVVPAQCPLLASDESCVSGDEDKSRDVIILVSDADSEMEPAPAGAMSQPVAKRTYKPR